MIGGAKHIPPKHYEISALMQALIKEYNNNWRDYHPVVKATLLHGEFLQIHHFINGNGRTSRLILNFELMRNGYTPIIIKNVNRVKYCEVLDIAHTNMNYEPFIELASDLVIESEKLWISLLD